MIVLRLDGSISDDYNFNRKEINDLRELVVDIAAKEVYESTVELATKNLHSTRNAYISGLSIRNVNRFTKELVLDGSSIAGMIEVGSGSFDMKPYFEKSKKVKYSKTGNWYMTIPMLFRTTAASPTSALPGQILPRRIYDLIRQSPTRTFERDNTTISILGGKAIPKRYDPMPKSVINELTNKAEEYIPKSSIYSGLIRTKNEDTGKSAYNTFRRVSANSNPLSWYHPGLQARNFMDQAEAMLDHSWVINRAVEQYLDNR